MKYNTRAMSQLDNNHVRVTITCFIANKLIHAMTHNLNPHHICSLYLLILRNYRCYELDDCVFIWSSILHFNQNLQPNLYLLLRWLLLSKCCGTSYIFPAKKVFAYNTFSWSRESTYCLLL